MERREGLGAIEEQCQIHAYVPSRLLEVSKPPRRATTGSRAAPCSNTRNVALLVPGTEVVGAGASLEDLNPPFMYNQLFLVRYDKRRGIGTW